MHIQRYFNDVKYSLTDKIVSRNCSLPTNMAHYNRYNEWLKDAAEHEMQLVRSVKVKLNEVVYQQTQLRVV